jgi:endogenous inhibitor of DNA gyrase (YacG/DUF329 family)
MASLKCPHCGASMPSDRTSAQVAVSTLIPAPAVPDMATQMRCNQCGRVSAASELRRTVADRFAPMHTVLWVLAAAFLAWVFSQLLFR